MIALDRWESAKSKEILEVTIHHQKGARRGRQRPTCGPELDHTHHSEVDAVVSVPRRRAPQPSARTPASKLSVRVNPAQGPEGGRSSSYPRYVTPDASGGEFPGVTQPPGFDRVTTDRVSERDSRAVSSIREGLVKCALRYPGCVNKGASFPE